jgi:hypothetical protein
MNIRKNQLKLKKKMTLMIHSVMMISKKISRKSSRESISTGMKGKK